MTPEPAQRRPASLAWRLTLSIALVIALVFSGLGWVIQHSIEQHFVEQDAEELDVVVHSVERVLANQPPAATAQDIAQHLAGAVSGHHGIYFLVADASGNTLFATPGPSLARMTHTLPVVAGVDADRLQDWQEQGRSFRGAVLRFEQATGAAPAYTLVVATATDFHAHFLVSFRRTIWLSMAVAGLLAVLASWLAVYQGHAPLRRMSDRIRGISVDRLHLRLDPQSVPRELSGLAGSFNAMLERIEQDFQRLSHFSADIAHELRTPITNLTTQTQVLLSQSRDVDDYREVLYSNLEEYERMGKMIGDMLYLAQTDNHLIKPELAEVDLVAEVDLLFDYFEAWAEERQIQLKREGQLLGVRGDRGMLRRAISNLLSNAIRYTHLGGEITVTQRQNHDAVSITVSNSGETIAAEHLPHLFDRFYRADPSRHRNGDGAGLGLSIVKAIVEAHGGMISVQSSGGRTAFEIRLPQAPM